MWVTDKDNFTYRIFNFSGAGYYAGCNEGDTFVAYFLGNKSDFKYDTQISECARVRGLGTPFYISKDEIDKWNLD